MKLLFGLLLFATLINGKSFEKLKNEYNGDNTWSRFGRAAAASTKPPAAATVPPGKAGNSPVFEIVTRHMKLARLFNALYLNIELSEQKIDSKDVIAGLWDLSDTTVLDKLVSLKTDELSTQLKTLDEKVKAVPGGIKQIADVEKIREKFEVIGETKAFLGKKVFTSDDESNIPKVIREKLLMKPLSTLNRNLADEVLQLLDTLVNSTVLDTTYSGTLVPAINAVVERLRIDHVTLLVNPEFNEVWSDSIDASYFLHHNFPKLNELWAQFGGVQTAIGKVPLQKKDFDTANIQLALQKLQSLLAAFHQSHDSVFIVPAFKPTNNLTLVNSDLEDKSLRELMNEGKSIQSLEKVIDQFRQFATGYLIIEKEKEQISKSAHVESLFSVLESVNGIVSFQEISNGTIVEQMTSCLSGKQIVEPDLAISNHWKVFLNDLSVIDANTPKKDVLDGYRKKITQYTTDIQNLDDADLAKFKQETVPGMKTIFEEISEKVFKPVTLDQTFIDSVNELSDPAALTKFQEIQKWASGTLLENNILKEECKFVFDFNVDSLNPLNKIPKSITLLRSKNPIEKLQPLLQAIPKVKAGLEALSSSPPQASPSGTVDPPTATKTPATQKPQTQPKASPKTKRSTTSSNSTELDIRYPAMLLDVAQAIRGLEQMSEISQLDADLNTVIQKGDTVLAAIQTMKDQKRKDEVEKVWKDFPNIKAQLMSLKENSKKALALVKAQQPEKDLKKVGKVYESISGVKFTEKIHLRQLRSSMKLMETPNPEVEKSLEKLEMAVSGDWNLTHANFLQVPDLLVTLQKEFEEFFDAAENGGKGAGEQGGFEKILMDNLVFVIIGFIVLLLAIAGSIVLCVYCNIYYDKEMKKKLERDEDYKHDLEDKESIKYSYMQLQDARLKINARDPKTGEVAMWPFLVKRDWEGLKKLVREGCVVDATCNMEAKLYRTILQELVAMKDPEICKFMLNRSADQTLHDVEGVDCDDWSDTFAFELFQTHYTLRETNPIPRVLPKEPRPWNVLFYNKKCIPRKMRKKLPLRIKKQCTWGYMDGMDLNKFTHIVLPQEMVKKEKELDKAVKERAEKLKTKPDTEKLDEELAVEKLVKDAKEQKYTLRLNDEHLLRFKLLGCLGNLMEPGWVQALIDHPDEAMRKDFKHYVLNCEYRKETHGNSVFEHKTAIHRLRPSLLEGIVITFMDTEDETALEQQKEWEEIIPMFGGKVQSLEQADKMVGTANNIKCPYHTMGYEYMQKQHKEQNPIWLLKYPDTKKNQKYIDNYEYVSLVNIQFLPECLARFYILELANKVVPLAIDEEEAAKTKAAEEKAKNEANASTTATTNTTSSVVSTMSQATSASPAAGGKKRLGRIGKSREKGELKPRPRPAYSMMKAAT